MIVSVIAFSLVAAIFLAVLVEMYVEASGRHDHARPRRLVLHQDFAIRYLVYAFSVGMKLMSLVMIAKIGSDVLIGLAQDSTVGDQYQTALARSRNRRRYLHPRNVRADHRPGRRSRRIGQRRHGGDPSRIAGCEFRGRRRGARRRRSERRRGRLQRARAGGSSFGGAASAGLRGAASAGGARRLGRPRQGDRRTRRLCRFPARPRQRQTRQGGGSGSPTPPPENTTNDGRNALGLFNKIT